MGKFESKLSDRLFRYKLNKFNEPMIISSYINCHNIIVYFPNKNIFKKCDYSSFKNGTVDSFKKNSYNRISYGKDFVQIRCYDKKDNYKGFFIVDFDSYEKIKEYIWCMKTHNSYPYKVDGSVCTNLHSFLLDFPKNFVIDHINRLKWDNRLNNLRIVSNSLNIRNRGLNKNNSSGIKGVSYYKNSWSVELYSNGMRYKGKFDTFLEACVYRRKLELLYSKDCLQIELEIYLKDVIKDTLLLKELYLEVNNEI